VNAPDDQQLTTDNTLLTYDIGRGIASEGDSGGPAALTGSGDLVLLGVLTGSINLRSCAEADSGLGQDYVGVYTRVDSSSSAFVWIQSIAGRVQVADII
jgi:hypothetical protein